MDHLPVAQPEPDLPRPRLPTLTLLVGRITTIKLVYWAGLTAWEIALALTGSRHDERFPVAVLVGATLTVLALIWAGYSARAVDRRVGTLERSIPTIATTFMAASVVATPASLPLLFIEIQHGGEGCARGICHWEAIWYWVAAVAIGTVLIPLVFAARMRGPAPARS